MTQIKEASSAELLHSDHTFVAYKENAGNIIPKTKLKIQSKQYHKKHMYHLVILLAHKPQQQEIPSD